MLDTQKRAGACLPRAPQNGVDLPAMADVTIYTRPMCPYCVRAVQLLKEKGVDFEEIDAGFDRAKKEEMISRANGARTFPQIFIGDNHVGGCDDMFALERQGKLDAMLENASAK